MIIISLTFFIMAAICNAVMDISNQHYSTSILTKLNPNWWDGTISWKNKYIDEKQINGRVKWFGVINKPVQLTDAFHFFKMWMIIFCGCSIITFDKCLTFFNCQPNWYSYPIVLFLYGMCWNFTFSLFYDKILKK